MQVGLDEWERAGIGRRGGLGFVGGRVAEDGAVGAGRDVGVADAGDCAHPVVIRRLVRSDLNVSG